MGAALGSRGICNSVVLGLAALVIAGPVRAQTPLGTNIQDFFLRGTQPNSLTNNIVTHNMCSNCHAGTTNITQHWQGNIMAQAARDPLFYACLDIAEHVTPGSGDLCIRCHAPKAWLEGRSTPTNGSALLAGDRDGITCNFCHRLVDPLNPPGEPAGDTAIINALIDGAPLSHGDGSYVVDPTDKRRGPFSDVQCGTYHAFDVSPFFQKAAICGTCHDVSNPAFERQIDGTYALGPLQQRHSTADKRDMRPVERTYSEWLNSAYAAPPGVPNVGDRFGKPGQPYIGICQDCHMPDTSSVGCTQAGPVRPDMPQHMLHGAANWVLDAILAKYGLPPGSNELTTGQRQAILDAKVRNVDMLQRAATLSAIMEPNNSQLRVRVTNETGHKLPSGYPEGRRIWINVKFRDCNNAVIAEHGAYDGLTATLTTTDTKVYEIESGVDSAVASATGLPVGHSFFFTLNNVILKDNRIPPRGFTNAAFAAAQAAPVDYSYADGQYWDETLFTIPAYAVYAEVELLYQTSSREYIEFLRDQNPNAPPNRGTELYDLWVAAGKGAPIAMASTGAVNVALFGDLDGNRGLNTDDAAIMANVLLGLDNDPDHVCMANMNGTGGVDGADLQLFIDALIGP
ncbi:MAG: hypothetical protein L6Q92_14425 [Phycisphaerae bacterium]|nr:hypothetical protein [Phycisphaerae bacterium]